MAAARELLQREFSRELPSRVRTRLAQGLPSHQVRPAAPCSDCRGSWLAHAVVMSQHCPLSHHYCSCIVDIIFYCATRFCVFVRPRKSMN